MSMKIVFFGSDDFAAVSLKRLIASPHQVVAVVSPPDRARHRGKVTFLPVKQLALENQIPVFQPEDPGEASFQSELSAFESDVFVVIAYGKILSQTLLRMPKMMCVNVHASLLPAYRGAAPISRAVMDGQILTGVTLIKMNERMDAGDMIAQAKMTITDNMNAQMLRGALAVLGAETLVRSLANLEAGQFSLTPQDESKATFAPKLTRSLEVIDWSCPARHIHNLIRGLAPRPAAYGVFQGKRLKILKASVINEDDSSGRPGTVIEVASSGIAVACGSGCLLLEILHPESSKPMDAKSFSLGHQVHAGDRFKREK